MDKELLFEFLRTRLRDAGFSEKEIALHISQLEERYAAKSDDEIEADINKRGGAAKAAAAIIERRNTVFMQNPDYRAFVEQSAAEQTIQAETVSAGQDAEDDVKPYVPKGQSASGTDAVPLDSEDELLSWFGGQDTANEKELPPLHSAMQKTPRHFDAPQRTVPPSRSRAPQRPISQNGAAPRERDLGSTKVIAVPQKPPVQKPIPAEEEPLFAAVPEPVQDIGISRHALRQKVVPNTVKTGSHLADITYWGEGTEEGYRRFWILFAISLPFVVCLLLIFAALAVGIAVALAVGMAGLVVLLVGVVAAGAAISLVGVIYGISQLFLTLPIGLFECGIGITVIGVTMLVGILIYNLAIRFLPFVFKQFLRFIRFFISFLQDLYYYLKGECYRR